MARVAADDSYTALGWTRETGTTGGDYGRSVYVGVDTFIYVTGGTQGALNGQLSAGTFISYTYNKHQIMCK